MKALGFAIQMLLTLVTTPALATDPVSPSCITAYDDIRAGKLSEAAARMAECGAASKPSRSLTVLLFDRVRVLDKLGRHDEAFTQLRALTDKAHFETGLADEFSGPGVWSRDPDRVKTRQATGQRRFDLLLDIAWRYHLAKDYRAAMDWAERAARHALARYRLEGEFFPLDQDAGCAIALRGMARFELDPQSGKQSWPDLSRGYVRGCTKLPIANDIATLPEGTRKRFDALKASFDVFQVEVARVSEAIRKRETTAGADNAALDALARSLLSQLADRLIAMKPVLKQRADYLAAETGTLGREALFEIEGAP